MPVFPPHVQPAESIRVHAGPRIESKAQNFAVRSFIHTLVQSREFQTK